MKLLEDKGTLLYKENRKKYKKSQRVKIGGYGIATFCIGIFFIMSLLLQFPVRIELARIGFLIGGTFFFIIGVGLISEALFGIDDLKIYKTGIVLPSREVSDIWRRRENFLPFSDINRLYLNTYLNTLSSINSYVVITRKRGRPIIIFRDEIGDINKFKKTLESKISIINDIDWLTGKNGGECLHPPKSTRISKEGIFFEFVQKELFIRWDKLKKIRVNPGPVWIFYQKDGMKIFFYEINDEIKKKIISEFKKHI